MALETPQFWTLDSTSVGEEVSAAVYPPVCGPCYSSPGNSPGPFPLPLLSPFTRAHQALCVAHLSPEVAWSPTQNFAPGLCFWPLLAITWVSQIQLLGLSEPSFLNLIAQIPMLVHRVTVVVI